MAMIGTFTKHDDGFIGSLRTLTFNVKVRIVPATKENDKGPDYRVLADAMEIGAAWKRQTPTKKAWLSVKLDDPSFAAPVNARLIDAEDGTVNLFWTRRTDE